MTETRFKNYGEVLNILVAEAVICAPESWRYGKLSIECDGADVNYHLENNNETSLATLSEELRARCEQLYMVMREFGDIWLEAIIEFSEQDGVWDFTTKFNYDREPQFEPIMHSEKISEPWWKLY